MNNKSLEKILVFSPVKQDGGPPRGFEEQGNMGN